MRRDEITCEDVRDELLPDLGEAASIPDVVRAHLESCADCRSVLHERQQLGERLRAVPRRESGSERLASFQAVLDRHLAAEEQAWTPLIQSVPRRSAPVGLWARVLDGLRARGVEVDGRPRWRKVSAFASVAAAILLVAGLFTLQGSDPVSSRPQAWTGEFGEPLVEEGATLVLQSSRQPGSTADWRPVELPGDAR